MHTLEQVIENLLSTKALCTSCGLGENDYDRMIREVVKYLRENTLDLHPLGADEREILKLVRDRAVQGAKTYGPLRISDDTRDFSKEALAEVVDAQFYAGALYLQQMRKKEGK